MQCCLSRGLEMDPALAFKQTDISLIRVRRLLHGGWFFQNWAWKCRNSDPGRVRSSQERVTQMPLYFFVYLFPFIFTLFKHFTQNCCSVRLCVAKTHMPFSMQSFYLWNDNHLTPSQRTTPEVIRSSAKYWVSIPSSSCFLNWIPDVVSSSIESWAYMSSLAGEEETQHSKVPYFKLFFSTYIHNDNATDMTEDWPGSKCFNVSHIWKENTI